MKLPINGIRLSGALVQINLAGGGDFSAGRFFRDLAVRRINVSMAALTATDGRLSGACCIREEDLPRAKRILDRFSESLRLISPVGALTVFPHRAHFDLLGCMLSVFGRRSVPVFAIASSLAALTFTTDYERLDEAVAAVLEKAALPENHAPLRPEFRVRQL